MRGYSKIYGCGIFFAFLDLLQGISVLAFYSYQQYDHRHCQYTHKRFECEFFQYDTNHSVRTIIGLAEGVMCILISFSLFACFSKEKRFLVWAWLAKPLVCLVLNLYFVVTWLIQRGRNYYSYDTTDQEWQESVFIAFGGLTAGLHFLMAFFFCCTSAGFFYRVKKNRRNGSVFSFSSETKV